jgi:hypothetical protein
LALAHGGSLTINPDTGLPEAGFLKKILPAIAGAGLSYLSGGLLTPMMAAGLVGGGTALATGSLEKGLMAGLGAYGGAGLTAGLSSAGAQQILADQTAEQAARFGADAMYERAVLPTAGEALSRGAEYAMSNPTEAIGAMGGMGKVAMMGGAAAAPTLFADQNVPTATKMPPGMIRPMRYTSEGWVAEEPYEATQENIDERWASSIPKLTTQEFAAGGMPIGGQFGRFGGQAQPAMGFGGRPFTGTMPPQAQAQFQRPQMVGYGMPGSPAQAAQAMQGEFGRFMAQRGQAPAPGVMEPQAQAGPRLQAVQGGLDQLRQQAGVSTGGSFVPRFAEGGSTITSGVSAATNALDQFKELMAQRAQRAQLAAAPAVPGMTGQSAQSYNYLMGRGPAPAQIRPTFAKIEEAPWIKKKREEEAAKAAQAARAAVPGVAPAYDPFNIGPGAVYDPGNLSGGGMAAGGLAGLARGGRFLRGPGDGTSDSIKASINGQQPARLADGEFVIDARTVSEIGNGSSEAGAKKLYAMMDRVHAARRSAKRGKPSSADRYLPA